MDRAPAAGNRLTKLGRPAPGAERAASAPWRIREELRFA